MSLPRKLAHDSPVQGRSPGEVPRAPGTFFSFRTLVPVTWHGVCVLLRWMSVSLGVGLLHKDKDLSVSLTAEPAVLDQTAAEWVKK